MKKTQIMSCHAKECNISQYLVYVHNGWFCYHHSIVLNEIREKLTQAKGTPAEWFYREQEVVLRKHPCPRHKKALFFALRYGDLCNYPCNVLRC